MVRALVTKHLSVVDLRGTDPSTARQAGWGQLADLGLLGIAWPERYGGG
jgi:3-oxochol-4-en-24-oyl-CoA dehydrogenase